VLCPNLATLPAEPPSAYTAIVKKPNDLVITLIADPVFSQDLWSVESYNCVMTARHRDPLMFRSPMVPRSQFNNEERRRNGR
jgi:hypothetical protein